MLRLSLVFALLCSVAQAQLVSIDWENKTVGEHVVSVTENPVPLTPEQLVAQGFTRHVDHRGKVYWSRKVMSGCASGECGPDAQRPLQLSGSS